MNLRPLVYQAIGASQGSKGHPVGTFRVIDLSDKVIDAVAAEYLRSAKREIDEHQAEIDEYDPDEQAEYEAFHTAHYFLDYERYLFVLKNVSRLGLKPALEIQHFLDNFYYYKSTPTRGAWLEYVSNAVPDFYAFLTSDLPLSIPDQATFAHSYIVAGSGAGKSTLLKKLIWSYITSIDAAVVIVDPTGEFCREVAEFKEFVDNDRLVYLSANLELGQKFTINPLHISGVDPRDMSKVAVQAKRAMAEEIYEALTEVIGEGQGAGFSINMEAVLKPCLLALLDKPGATLFDLKRFMQRPTPPDLLALGQANPDVQKFFTNDFMGDNFNPTKTAVGTKVGTLFGTGILADMTCGESTVDLEREIEKRKVIIFDLNEAVVKAAGAAFGRLVVSLIKGIATRRALVEKHKRVPTHLIIDECSDYICPSIRVVIQKQRKLRLMLTLCQTEVGSGMSHAIADAVTGSTNVQIMGPIGSKHWSEVGNLVNVPRHAFEPLKIGEFYIRFGRGNPSIKFKVGSEFVGDAHGMTKGQWERVRRQQLRAYYRGIAAPKAEIIPPATPPVRRTEAAAVTDVILDEDMKPAVWKRR
jgi:hypothetical protein